MRSLNQVHKVNLARAEVGKRSLRYTKESVSEPILDTIWLENERREYTSSFFSGRYPSDYNTVRSVNWKFVYQKICKTPMLTASTRTLNILAAFVWYVGGIVLIIKGSSLLVEGIFVGT